MAYTTEQVAQKLNAARIEITRLTAELDKLREELAQWQHAAGAK